MVVSTTVAPSISPPSPPTLLETELTALELSTSPVLMSLAGEGPVGEDDVAFRLVAATPLLLLGKPARTTGRGGDNGGE